MDVFGDTHFGEPGAAAICRGTRRNFQRRRQLYLLRLRAGLVPVDKPFVEIDKQSIVFVFKEADIKDGSAGKQSSGGSAATW